MQEGESTLRLLIKCEGIPFFPIDVISGNTGIGIIVTVSAKYRDKMIEHLRAECAEDYLVREI